MKRKLMNKAEEAWRKAERKVKKARKKAEHKIKEARKRVNEANGRSKSTNDKRGR